MVQAPAEGCCGALILTLLPACLYAIIHWHILGHWVHTWSLLLLASTPILFLSVLEASIRLSDSNCFYVYADSYVVQRSVLVVYMQSKASNEYFQRREAVPSFGCSTAERVSAIAIQLFGGTITALFKH